MDLIDYLVFFLFFVALIGLSYRNSKKSLIAKFIHEGFEEGAPVGPTTLYLLYSLTSKVPGKKCRENYKLFKENRYYMQLWTRLKSIIAQKYPEIEFKSINVDEAPEYVSEFNIDTVPALVLEKDNKVQQLKKENLPTMNEVLSFLQNNYKPPIKDLNQYDNAIVYLYVPNCTDCRKYFAEWLDFKKEMKATYPDMNILEVDVSRNPAYKKYTYKFSSAVYPLILTKNLGKVTTSDIIQLYGDFTAENLFLLTDEIFFAEGSPTFTEMVNTNNLTQGPNGERDQVNVATYENTGMTLSQGGQNIIAENPAQSFELEPTLDSEEMALDQLLTYDDAIGGNPLMPADEYVPGEFDSLEVYNSITDTPQSLNPAPERTSLSSRSTQPRGSTQGQSRSGRGQGRSMSNSQKYMTSMYGNSLQGVPNAPPGVNTSQMY
jgi:hypothetical protein